VKTKDRQNEAGSHVKLSPISNCFRLGLSEAHPGPFARLTHHSAIGLTYYLSSRPVETPDTTSTERKLSLMARCDGVSPHEKESAARYTNSS